jgi:hypothetical protein
MSRLVAAMLVRIGLVMLVLAVLVRLLPMPNRADVMADEFSIVISLVLFLAASIYLRLTKDDARDGKQPETTIPLTSRRSIQR